MQVGDHSDRRVEREDIAPPDQVEMDEAEDEQPGHAAVVDHGRIAAPGLGALDDEQQRGAEQEREEAAHLAVDQDEAEHPGGKIGRALGAISQRVQIGGTRHGEGDDVHRQYPHHGDAADDIQCGDALARRGAGHAGTAARRIGWMPRRARLRHSHSNGP